VAVGKLRLVRGRSGGYVATLTAHTTGVLGWFLRYRKDTYRAWLQEVNGGRLMTWKKWKRGKLRDSGELKMEPGIFYDGPLTAFYNFRFGVYGPIGEGREYWIKTFPKSSNKEVDIYLRLATKSEFKRRFSEKAPFDAYLADVKIDKEGVAKDIILFGDVRGKFVEGAFP
jgi:hypothetical protein